jgi:hypothetical protein
MLNDKLYSLFEQRLSSSDFETSTQEEFIFRVVEDYVLDLIQAAHIPIHHLKTLQEDLEEEVSEMLKKKTYGFFSIKEYREALKSKKAGNL